jgi:DNA-binding XRE family transcriptional regulator
MNAFEKARIESGLTIADLAREANMSRSTIEKMQHDEPVKVEYAVRACRVLSKYLDQPVTYESLGIKTV